MQFLNSYDDSDSGKFSLLNPRQVDFEEERHDSVSPGPISANSLVDTQLQNEIYYICSQLNKRQCLLFDSIMYHLLITRFAEDSNMEPIEPHHIFLSGDAGVVVKEKLLLNTSKESWNIMIRTLTFQRYLWQWGKVLMQLMVLPWILH